MSRAGIGWMPLLAALGGATGTTPAPLVDVPGDVDLTKSAPVHGSTAWAGRRVGEVVEVEQIERIVLLKAVTSAMAGLDLANIRRLLADAADTRFLDEPAARALLRMGHDDTTWEAVLLMRDGRVLGFTAGGGRACLQAGDGQGGCFERRQRAP